MSMEYVTASKLKRYRACPRQCKYEPFKKNPIFDFGTAVHAGIAAMATGADPEIAYAKEARSLGLPDDLRERARIAFETVKASERVALSSDKVVSVESSDGDVMLHGKKYFQVPMVDDVYGIRGSMDLVDYHNEGLRILDWKTGQSSEEDDLQLAVYALAAWKKYQGFEKIETAFFYVEKDIYQSSFWNQESLVGAFEYVDAIAHKFLNERDWLPTPHKGCTYCGIKENCPAYGKMIEQTPDTPGWDVEATLDNLPVILERLAKIEAIEKAAGEIAGILKTKRNSIMKEAGSVTLGGRVYKYSERVSRYDYDLPTIFANTQTLINRPPLEICSFDSGGFDMLVKICTDKVIKRQLKDIKEGYCTVKGRSSIVSVSIAKETSQPAEIEEAEASDAE